MTNLSKPTGASTALVSPKSKDPDKALVVNHGRFRPYRPETNFNQVRKQVIRQERVNTEEDIVHYSGVDDTYGNDYAQSVQAKKPPVRKGALSVKGKLNQTMSEQRLTMRTNITAENHRPLKDERYFARVQNKDAASLMRLEKLVERKKQLCED